MSKTAIRIGPADNGRRMSLEEFEAAEVQDGRLRIGVKEYWIVDPDRQVLVVMRRSRGRWIETTIKPPEAYRSRLLPGFEFSIEAVFQSAGLI
jgi:Uma2 family endonuclease